MSIIKDFIQGFQGFLKSVGGDIVQGSIHDEVSKYIDEAVEKSMKKMFVIGAATSLIGIGSFLFLWGIASAVDRIFNMGGLGYMIFGVLGILIGMLIYERFNKKNKGEI